jgi:hypothetical protein
MGSRKKQSDHRVDDDHPGDDPDDIPAADAEPETTVAARNPTVAQLEAEVSRVKALEAEAVEGRLKAERSFRDTVLRETLRAALVEAGAKPERTDLLVTILVGDGRITLDPEGRSLIPVNEEDLDVALLLSEYRAKIPELFRGEGAAPNGARPTPPKDKYSEWRRRLEAER